MIATPSMIVAALLGLSTILAWGRLILWHRAALATGQGTPMRMALLLLLQPITALLLFLALFPPTATEGETSLRVATAGASRLAGAPSGAPLVLLPEAPRIDGGEALPDLATALRRHPGIATISVVGNGLTARDIDAARTVAVRFDPPPQRPGIVDLTPPAIVAPGAPFTVGGTLAGLSGAMLDLVDPAGRITDSRAPDRNGHFLLTGTARAAGAVNFTLRVRLGRRVAEQADVPVWVQDAARPRLLILAGAPGPEVKYLRRWASDAGFDVTTRMSAGGGIALGDATVALDAASLRRYDVAVVDDRSWASARGPLLGAVRGGLGLLLRAGGPLDGATRSQWQGLGFTLTGPGGVAPLALPKVQDAAMARTRHGIGSDDMPVDMALPEDLLPDVSRLGLAPGGPGAVPLLHQDPSGTPLAAWRALGTGRIALFTGIDSYALTLTGRRDLYQDWWSGMLSTLVRPAPGTPASTDTAWVGERLTLCGLSDDARVDAPSPTTLLPVAGCAAYWPTRAGWHMARNRGVLRPFYVQPDNALPIMRAARDGQAMAMLRTQSSDPVGETTDRPAVPSWFWWLAWLAASALLWWLEGSRLGRRVAFSPDAPPASLASGQTQP